MGCGFCESALSNSVGTLVVDCVVKPVGRQLDYVCRFHDNVEKLRERKGELTMARDLLRQDIEDAERQLQRIYDVVRDVQSKADKILTDVETLEKEIGQNKRCFNWCPNWSWRYRLSKKAMKKTQDISKLLEKIPYFCQPGRVGYRDESALPKIGFWCSEEFVGSKSADTAFNEIMKYLQDESISLLGLRGMGGVGKTTLARQVGDHAEKSNLFKKVVIATVSQRPNFEAIQDNIARYLGFDMKNERGIRKDVQDLWLRLKKEERILIILDDVWAFINLKEEIGIPHGKDHNGCKVLLTTRSQEVCEKIYCQKVVTLGCLDGQEAWTLFAKKAGLNDSSKDDIKMLAHQIIKKCGGLPIALATLGSALKDKQRHWWEVAHQRLKNGKLTEIQGVIEKNAYLCLEASFDFLEGEETKNCFLLCSLFPEDYEIYVEDLVRYAWGLVLYEDSDSIEEVRNEVLTAMDILKGSCLLLDCGERHVKMHDLVREVALWIASSRKGMSLVINSAVETWPKDEKFEHYTAISLKSSQIVEPPKGLVFPSLKVLLLGEEYADPIATSNEFFEGMKALEVCALDGMLISLAAFQFQANLRALHLKNCKISDISMLGKLKSLQVLSFNSCDMTELPSGTGELESLKLLELSNCENLRRIPHSTLRLSNLEELYLDGCRSIKWAIENATEKESYFSLSDLNSLPKLAVLSLDISLEQLPKGFVFCKLQRFDVRIGRQRWYGKRDVEICPISRSLQIETAVEACKQLFEGVESLHLTNVKTLWIDNCKEMNLATPVLKNLEVLQVESCDEMQVLFQISELRSTQQGLGHLVSLQSLKVVEIDSCNKLRFLFPMSVANSLGQLETLKIKRCLGLEEIIQATEVAEIQVQQELNCHLSFRSLKVVEIDSCNKLRYLFPTSVANSLGQLETLKIKSCLGLEEIIQATEVPDISLRSLREVHVEKCNNLTSLSSLSHGQSLENLVQLVIKDCDRLEYTFPISMAKGLPQLNEVCLVNLPQFKGGDGNDIVLSLRSLRSLQVHGCPQLISFTISVEIQVQQGLNRHLSFQSLKVVEIYECNHLKYLFPTSVANSLGQLETLNIMGCLGLEEIIQATEVPGISLRSLMEVHVEKCNNLTSLSSLSHGQSLENLIQLVIRDCDRLEYTFPISMAKGLPQLNEVCLVNLPQFKGGDGNDIVLSLRSLRSLQVHGCPQLISFTISVEIQVQQGLNRHLSFQSLKVVKIYECNHLKYLFPTSVANSLGQLETLNIMGCLGLEEIIQATEVADISLRSLREVHVEKCNNLTSLSSLSHGQSLENLIQLVIRDCDRLEYTFPISMAKGLPQLNKVCLVNLPQFKGGDGNDIVLSLRSLRSLQVHCCPRLIAFTISVEIQVQQELNHHVSLQSLIVEILGYKYKKLKYLFPTSVANSLGQLETLKIKSCLGLEEIIQATEVAEVQVQQGLNRHLSFRSLKVVKIYRCNHLKYLFSKSVANSLGQLETLKIKSCLELEEIIQATEVAEVQVQQGLNRHPSFQSVKFVEIDSCNNLKCLFPTSVANSLGHLERLKIKSCLGLEEIIQATTVSDTCLQSLWFVEIDSCNNLKYLFPDICLQSLCVVEIDSCNNLKSLFPTSVANSLGKLKGLKIKSCFGLEEIIQATTVSDTCLQSLESVVIDSCNNLKYLFPTSVANSLGQLERLKIKSCLGLEEIIQATTVSDTCLQSLKDVEIDNCNNLKSLFPTSVANSLGLLKRLKIKSCLGLEEIIQATTVSDTCLQSLWFVEIDSCNNLKYLFPDTCLQSLRVVEIESCNNLKSLFPTSVANSLGKLEGLKIKSCFGLEEIIQATTVSDTCLQSLESVVIDSCNNLKYLFPTSVANSLGQLERLEIKSCLGLEEIIQATTVSDTYLQSLKDVQIDNCNNLKSLFPTSVASSLGLLKRLKIKSCLGLEEIIQATTVSDTCLQSLWFVEIDSCNNLKYLFPDTCLQNLCIVEINSCNNLKSLFSTSVADSLGKLERLKIKSCLGLEEIIQAATVSDTCLQSLRVVEIDSCNNLKFLFSTSVANSLGKLERLKIKSCLGLEEIIQAATVSDTCLQSLRVVEIDSCNNLKFLFSTSVANSLGKLERLKIKSCLGLEEIIQATTVSATCLQSLWFVEIDSCNNLKSLFPTSVANSLGKLERLEIKSCLGLEEIIQATTVSDTCLQSLKVVERDSCNNLKSLFSTSVADSLGKLKRLKIKSCFGLEEIIQGTTVSDTCLQSLKVVEIDSCNNLKSLFPTSVADSLGKLKRLKIKSCLGLEEIIQGTTVSDTCLQSLKVVEIDSCNNLKSLFPTSIVDSLGKLERLKIKSCLGLEEIIQATTVSDTCLQSLWFVEIDSCNNLKSLFPTSVVDSLGKLERLKIKSCLGLKEIIQATTVSDTCLQSLRVVEIDSCNNLKSLFPMSVANSLGKLKRPKIKSCLGLEEIIQAMTVSDTCLQSLKVVKIDSCNNLKSLFPTSVANSLGQLERLKIKSCLGLEEIIQATTVSNTCLQSLKVVEIDSCVNLKSLFPTSVANSLGKLKRLEIKSCLGLEEIIQATTVSDTCLQSLKVVEIDSCNNLKSLFPTSVANSLRQLERLEIKSCFGLEEIIKATTVSNTCLQSLEVVDISLRSLREVHVEKCNNLTSLSSLSHGQSLENLIQLVIKDCDRLEYTFPISMAKGLPQLNEVCLVNLPQFKGGDGNDIVLSLRSLRSLQVHGCPQLISFTISVEIQVQQGLNRHLSFQSLKVVEIYECNHLKYLFPTSVANSLGQLETLNIMGCLGLEEIIQATEVPGISLRSLMEVHVEKCNNLTSLSSLSHGQSLENLIQLVIRDCDRLEYTFPISMAKGLPQLNEVCLVNLPQFKGGDGNDIVLSLRSLRSLQVHGCPQLISFTISVEIQVQQGLNRHLSFRSLKVVKIYRCNHLKYLFPKSVANSLGQLETLKIKSCLELEEIIQATEVAEVQVQQGLNRHPSFLSVKVVEIDSCNNLKYLFPTSVANSLGQLEILKIKSCLGLEEIIQATEVFDICLQSLREVHVEKCDNLTSLSSLSHGQSLENLIELVIEDCNRLKYTFPISMAKGLPQLNEVCLVNLPQFEGSDGNDIVLPLRSLRVLKVHGCPQLIPLTISAEIRELDFGGMKERKQMCNMVVPELKGRSANMDYLTITNFEDLFDSGYNLSSMRTLRLEALPELRVIWKGPVQVVNFQNLTDLEVHDCRRLRYIFSPTIASNLPQLSSLEISYCEELEQVIEKNQTSSQYHHRLEPICFPNLTLISIRECENLKCLFPITVAHCGLPKLGLLEVFEVSNLEQVFEEGDEANVSKDRQQRIQLPRLELLSLVKLSKLVSFSPVGYHFFFPLLDQLEIKDCPNITTSFSVDSEQSVHLKTEASQPVDGIIVEETATTHGTTWPIGSDISWYRW